MNIKILTLFDSYFDGPFSTGIIGNCVNHSLINTEIINLREYGSGNYKKCDDYPYGGGPGLVMTADLFDRYYKANPKCQGEHTVLFSPTGSIFNQSMARRLSKKSNITFILGHYEGIDGRVEAAYADECISIGDYVLSGGEAVAVVVVDAICRYKGGLGNGLSLENDSFESGSNGLLEYEQYSRPPSINGLDVPDVLLSGNHKNIAQFRRMRSLIRTFTYRKDIFAKVSITKEDISTIYNYLVEKSNDK